MSGSTTPTLSTAVAAGSADIGSIMRAMSSNLIPSKRSERALSPPPSALDLGNSILRTSSHHREGTCTPRGIYALPSEGTSTQSFLSSSNLHIDTQVPASPDNSSKLDASPTVSAPRGRSGIPARPLMSPSYPSSGSTATNATGTATKIRFAPLPQIRPRSYSTGRNVWLEPDTTDLTAETLGEKRGYIRRNHIENEPVKDRGSAIASDSDDSDSDDHRKHVSGRSSGIFSPERWGLEPHSKSQSSLVVESYTTKILRPLSFGLVKPKHKKLPRSASNDSIKRAQEASSRGSLDGGDSSIRHRSGSSVGDNMSMDDLSDGSTGHLGHTFHESKSEDQSHRRHYPSVVQRSRKKPPPKPIVKEEDPKFVEWGMRSVSGVGGGGIGNNNTRRSASGIGGRNPDQDDEEEGSGLAWIKRRKEERRKKAEEEAARVKAEEELALAQQPAVEVQQDQEIEVPALTITEPTVGSGTTTPTATKPAIPSPIRSQPFLFNALPLPASSSLPIASASATPSSSAAGDSSAPSSVSSAPSSDNEDVAVSAPLRRTTTLTRVGSESYAVPVTKAGSDSDEEEEEDQHDHSREEEDDLTAEEIALEDALAAKAKANSLAAGSERFHSSGHHDQIVNI